MPRLFFWLLPSLLIALLWLANDAFDQGRFVDLLHMGSEANAPELELAQPSGPAIVLQLTAHTSPDPISNGPLELSRPEIFLDHKPAREIWVSLPIVPTKLAMVALWFTGIALLPWFTMGWLRRGVRAQSMGLLFWLELFLLGAMAGLGLWLFHGYWTDPAWWLYFLAILTLQTYQFEFYCEWANS